MRIAYVANIRFPTEKAHGAQIAKACEALSKAGEELELLLPARRTDIKTPALEYYGIKSSFIIRSLPVLDLVGLGKIGFWIESITFALGVLQYLRAHPFDLVYGRDELVLSILMLFGVKTVMWESHDGTWNISSRYVARRARGIVVVSHGLKEFYTRLGVREENIHASPNGISVADFTNPGRTEEIRAQLGIPYDKKVALYIGRLDGWKGVDTLLRASALLPDDFCVVLIGGEEQQIRAYRRQYPNVLFLGYRPYRELSRNQAAGDVLVVPNTAANEISVRFTSPLKLIAHMASKRPIVASDLPSIWELVDEECAVLVYPDDSAALAAGIQKAYGRSDLAERAFARAQALDWQVRADGILAFIKQRGVRSSEGR